MDVIKKNNPYESNPNETYSLQYYTNQYQYFFPKSIQTLWIVFRSIITKNIRFNLYASKSEKNFYLVPKIQKPNFL